jgi:hypothetical protein
MKKFASLVLLGGLGSVLVLAGSLGFVFTTLDFPGAVETGSAGVTDTGVVTGYYIATVGGNKLSFYGLPGSLNSFADGSCTGTVATGINASGTIVGLVSGCGSHSFLTTNNGASYTLFDPTVQSPLVSVLGSTASSINATGTVVGAATGKNSKGNVVTVGYSYNGTSYTYLIDPSAPNPTTGASGTLAQGINNSGDIVGDYVNATNQTVGFLLHNGVFYDIINPNGTGGNSTTAQAIDSNGDIFGTYKDAAGVFHGYALTGYALNGGLITGGTFTTLDDPNADAVSGDGTKIIGVSPNGQKIVGLWINQSGTNGFYATLNAPVRSDFNEDGHPDLVWQNTSSGAAVVWYMGGAQGSTYLSSNWLTMGVSGWTIVSIADINQDGHPDLVWQNTSSGAVAVWYMGGAQGATYLGSNWLSSNVSGWRVAGTADFNDDGIPDLVWQNVSNGQVLVWYMGGPQGNVYEGSNWLSGPVTGWTVVGTGDFNGDGRPDLIWQNSSTGQVVVWYMGGPQGNTYLSSNSLSGSVSGWTVVGAADFNLDGVPDLVWQNNATGQVAVWYMGGPQGNVYMSSSMLSGNVNGWAVVMR